MPVIVVGQAIPVTSVKYVSIPCQHTMAFCDSFLRNLYRAIGGAEF